jgi:Rrf2 family iron-sulfur cluster assembly transcriptional regulator
MNHGILKGIRGQRGGYELAREHHRITAEDIVRAANTVGPFVVSLSRSPLLSKVVMPALAQAENAFSAALARLTIADLAVRAEGLDNPMCGAEPQGRHLSDVP